MFEQVHDMLKWQAAKCFDNHAHPQRRDLNFELLYLHISTCSYRALESVSNIYQVLVRHPDLLSSYKIIRYSQSVNNIFSIHTFFVHILLITVSQADELLGWL